ncbi:MAG: hypothetical protein GEU74_00815 [Nitriliruptorales bacterium]|nr:hypothetical protein [Nitriliruptorales bacterium]
MATINMFRGFLVAGAVLAVVIAAVYQQWAAVVILSVGIAAHVALWVRLHRERAAASAAAPPGSPHSQPPRTSPS